MQYITQNIVIIADEYKEQYVLLRITINPLCYELRKKTLGVNIIIFFVSILLIEIKLCKNNFQNCGMGRWLTKESITLSNGEMNILIINTMIINVIKNQCFC